MIRYDRVEDTFGWMHPDRLTLQGIIGGSVAEAIASTSVDVVVDFTSASAVKDHALAAVRSGKHLVIGSSGLAAADFDELDVDARAHKVGGFAAGNFSVMAAVLNRAAVMAAEHLERWEVIGYGSETKADVPSGTARELAELMGAVRRPAPAVRLEET